MKNVSDMNFCLIQLANSERSMHKLTNINLKFFPSLLYDLVLPSRNELSLNIFLIHSQAKLLVQILIASGINQRPQPLPQQTQPTFPFQQNVQNPTQMTPINNQNTNQTQLGVMKKVSRSRYI